MALFGPQNQQQQYRMLLARQLGQPSSPVSSPAQGVAEALNRALTMRVMGQMGQREEQRRSEALKALAGAMTQPVEGQVPEGSYGPGAPQEPGPSDIARRLAANPDTAEYGLNMLMGDVDSKRKRENELALMKAKMPFMVDLERQRAEARREFDYTGGGDTGRLLDRIIEGERAQGRDISDIEALEILKGGAGARGKLEADIDLAREAGFEREAGTQAAKTEFEPERAGLVAEESAVGKATGAAKAELADLKASFPELMEVTDELTKLADVATYTMKGRFTDAFRRELGVDVGDAGEALAKMRTMIDVEVLPLLKKTFGAAFTVKEGEWLKATLGDERLSPDERKAQISVRVDGWKRRLKTLSRRTGEEMPEEREKVSLEDFLNEGN